MIRATSLVMTCDCCPSQWEGALDGGRMFYIRFRHGSFCLRASPQPTEDVHDAVNGDLIMELEHDGEGHDGVMGTELMKELTKDHVDWSLVDQSADASS